jgi:phage terminase large subunit-like protein
VFGEAKRAVEAEPELAAVLKVYRDAIEYPKANAIYRVLSAEAYTKHGLNPSLVIFDELHVQPDDELWSVMTSGSGTRKQPLVLAITTAGVKTDARGQESLCYAMYRHGLDLERGRAKEPDPTFFFRWFAAPEGCDYRDPAMWAKANPALGDFFNAEDLEVSVRSDPENVFRTLHLNQFVSAHSAWLPYGAWEAIADDGRVVASDEPVVLGFDGSWANDSTALVGATVGDRPHVFVIDCWESDGSADWRVDTALVEQRIREAVRKYRVVEVACDPYRWQDVLQRLDGEGLPIVEFPTNSLARMVPACQEFYTGVVEQRMTHDGDARLARHVGNAVTKSDARGTRIVKESKTSARKIDLAVASVIAHNRALALAVTPPVVVPRFISFE